MINKNAPWGLVNKHLKEYEKNKDKPFQPSPSSVEEVLCEHTQLLNGLLFAQDFLEKRGLTMTNEYKHICSIIFKIRGV